MTKKIPLILLPPTSQFKFNGDTYCSADFAGIDFYLPTKLSHDSLEDHLFLPLLPIVDKFKRVSQVALNFQNNLLIKTPQELNFNFLGFGLISIHKQYKSQRIDVFCEAVAFHSFCHQKRIFIIDQFLNYYNLRFLKKILKKRVLDNHFSPGLNNFISLIESIKEKNLIDQNVPATSPSRPLKLPKI